MDERAILDKIRFFDRFSDAEKKQILCAEHYFARYREGDYLIREEEIDGTLFILLQGSAIVSKRTKPGMILTTLTPGMVVGEISFLTNRPRISDVIATEETVCFTLTRMTLENLSLPLQNKIKDQLIDILVGRLDRTNQMLVETLSAIEGVVMTIATGN
ncbi:MAG: cyclic nucleotide-binding domain-containing protein [Magnetococcales bacterium]|nr:cyclic nucleotide-binding domain-containing protein [Magnetococcales bacterium]